MQEGQGNIQLSDLQAYTSRHGIASLPPSEVEQVFENIDAGKKNLVRQLRSIVQTEAVSVLQLAGSMRNGDISLRR
jgi:hypothetical protein